MNELRITEYKGIRVLTTQQIAKAYETDRKVISYNFNHNKERYAEGKHYICLTDDELKAFREIHDLPTNLNKLYLWTEKGAFLHAKSLNTDKAWDVYDRLVDTYFEKPQAKQLSPVEMMRIQLGMIDDHENRINNLENTMTIDYAQQESIRDLVSSVVIAHLGGKESNAYREIGKKVFAECNRDIKTYFAVNVRNNIPKLRFEESMEYVRNWHPCTNTVMCIRDCNAQMCIE
jgi:hypothetical protein|nr:MAG TPA: hypothetical protein [Caudoviricetes sp.]